MSHIPKEFVAKLNINVLPCDIDLDTVLTIVTSHVNNGKTFRAKSQYVFTTSREFIDPNCGCSDIVTEYLVEITDTVDALGNPQDTWAGWLNSLYVVAPARCWLSAQDQDPTGSYSKRYVRSDLPPYLRNSTDFIQKS